MSISALVHLRFTALVLALEAGVVGCSGSSTGHVHGTVKLPNGAPAQGVIVAFEDIAIHTLARSVTSPDGGYVLATSRPNGGVPLGTYRVAVRHPPARDSSRIEKRLPFHLRYESFDTSGLQYVVKQGNNCFDIALTNQ